MRKLLFFSLVLIGLAGCAHNLVKGYIPPQQSGDTISHTIDAPVDKVWTAAIEALGTQYFEITHVEKDSGLLTFSYNSNADPSEFVDCGTATITETDPYGRTRDYSYKPEAQFVNISYRVYSSHMSYKDVTYKHDSKVSLKTNLVFKASGPSQTIVSIASQYTLAVQTNRRIRVDAKTFQDAPPDIIHFSTNETGRIGGNMQCVSRRTFENNLVEQIKGKI